MSDARGFTTRALHSASGDEVLQEPLSAPIYQAATFAFDDMESFAAVSKTKVSGGYLYSRWANPTVDALARTISALEGTPATGCFASGMGAIHSALTAFVRNGDHIVSARQLYGGTFGLMAKHLPANGADVDLVDVTDHGEVEAAFRPSTKVLYFETIGNPTLPVADVDALVAMAHARGAVVIVDATFTPPNLLRAAEHGVDVVAHSATKYFGGHSDVTAGVVSGSREHVERIRLHAIDTGPVLAPMEAWLTLRGVQTLGLRMERVCANALAIARMLDAHANVERVYYPGLESHPQHELASSLLTGGFGGMISFEVAGGIEAGRRVMERARICKPAASLGGTKSLIVHPASVTHTQLTREERERFGVADGLLRLSVGIEDADDLLADLERALA